VATVLTLVVVPVLYSTVESGKLFLAALPGRVTARLARRHTQPIAVNPAAQDRSAD
jgi:hypothetical protein